MLAVDPEHRRLGLGRRLVERNLKAMRDLEADEAILETEVTNIAALKLYECKISACFLCFVLTYLCNLSNGIYPREETHSVLS